MGWRRGQAARTLGTIALAGFIVVAVSGCRSTGSMATAVQSETETESWRELFNGADLEGWQVVEFGGEGEVNSRDGSVILEMGDPFTGIVCTNPVPVIGYELALEARRILGNDFFCGLTFPYEDSHGTLIVGGWGGSLVGVSSIARQDASENETTQFRNFEQERWYSIRLRVEHGRIQAWIDEEKLVNVDVAGREISLRAGGMYLTTPLGITTWCTAGEIRGVRIRRLGE
jgi:hypothetical protein